MRPVDPPVFSDRWAVNRMPLGFAAVYVLFWTFLTVFYLAPLWGWPFAIGFGAVLGACVLAIWWAKRPNKMEVE